MSTNTQNGTGTGVLAHDAKWGNLWNSVVAAGIYAVIAWVGNFDWSSFPVWAGQVGVPVAGLVVGWLTSKALPRFKR
jgi:hypothetical protein